MIAVLTILPKLSNLTERLRALISGILEFSWLKTGSNLIPAIVAAVPEIGSTGAIEVIPVHRPVLHAHRQAVGGPLTQLLARVWLTARSKRK